jgi:hypothetical protein
MKLAKVLGISNKYLGKFMQDLRLMWTFRL